MLILAIETSSKSVSAALLNQSKLIKLADSDQSGVDQPDVARLIAGSTDQLPPGYVRKRTKRGSQTSRIFPPGASVLLAPLIRRLFDDSDFSIKDVQLVAVAIGPGAFTGLRVGVVTAKALAYSNDIPIIGINTLEAIAVQADADFPPDNSQRVLAVVNAQRQQIFTAKYQRTGSGLIQIDDDQILDRAAWLSQIQANDVLTGPGLKPLLPSIQEQNPRASIAPELCWPCQAETIGKLAFQHFQNGRRDSLWELEPLYFRPSAAEEVAKAKAAKKN